MKFTVALAASLAVVLVGCGSRGDRLGAAAAPSGPAQPSAQRDSQVLCLAAPPGSGSVDQALRSAQAALGKDPRRAAAWVEAGRQWVRKARIASDPGFYLNVDGCAAEALQVEPGFAAALSLRSLVLMNAHQFEQARALAETILSTDPENIIALGTLSDALLELGRYPEAAAAAQRQMDARPGMAAHARGSYLRWLIGDTRGARLLIRDALLDRNPADPEPTAWVFVEAGNLYWQDGDCAGADALYSEALNWVADQPAALLGRARVALARGDAGAALGFLRRAHALRPSVESAGLLHDASLAAGDAAGARTWFEQAVQLGRRGDRLNLGLFLTSRDRQAEEALQLIEEERRQRAGIYIDDAYAWALYRLHRIDEAEMAIQRALRLGTRDARLLYHAGAIALASGDALRGRRLIADALQLNPNFDPQAANEARRLLGAGSLARN